MSYTAYHLPIANEFPQEAPKLLAPTDNLQPVASTNSAERNHCQLSHQLRDRVPEIAAWS